MSSIISRKKRVKVKAVTSIFISTILIIILKQKDIFKDVEDKINFVKDKIQHIMENYNKYIELAKLYAPFVILGILALFILIEIKFRDPKKHSIITRIFIYINSLKPGNFGDSMIIIGIIFMISIVFMLLNSRLSMKLIIPIVISAMFLNKYPIQNMPCACQNHGSWYRCGDSFNPNSKICRSLKIKARKIAKIHGPLVKIVNGAYGLLPNVLLPDLRIPHIPLSTPAAGRLPVPGKVRGPRLPDCEFDPFAEARKAAEAVARAARAAAAAAARAAKAAWSAISSF